MGGVVGEVINKDQDLPLLMAINQSTKHPRFFFIKRSVKKHDHNAQRTRSYERERDME